MNALQPSRIQPQLPHPQRVPARSPRRRSQRHPFPHRAAAIEVGAKLTVNVVLVIAAVSALVRLIPYNLSHQEELQALQHEVKTLDQRVQALQADFNRRFDPQQARSVMQEQSNRVDPSQIRVIFSDTPETTASTQDP